METQAYLEQVAGYVSYRLAVAGLPLQPKGADAEPGVMVCVTSPAEGTHGAVWVGWNVAPEFRQEAGQVEFGTEADVRVRAYAHQVLTAMTQAVALILTAGGFSVTVDVGSGSKYPLQVVGLPADVRAALEQRSS